MFALLSTVFFSFIKRTSIYEKPNKDDLSGVKKGCDWEKFQLIENLKFEEIKTAMKLVYPYLISSLDKNYPEKNFKNELTLKYYTTIIEQCYYSRNLEDVQVKGTSIEKAVQLIAIKSFPLLQDLRTIDIHDQDFNSKTLKKLVKNAINIEILFDENPPIVELFDSSFYLKLTKYMQQFMKCHNTNGLIDFEVSCAEANLKCFPLQDIPLGIPDSTTLLLE